MGRWRYGGNAYYQGAYEAIYDSEQTVRPTLKKLILGGRPKSQGGRDIKTAQADIKFRSVRLVIAFDPRLTSLVRLTESPTTTGLPTTHDLVLHAVVRSGLPNKVIGDDLLRVCVARLGCLTC
jgi:hypothetical protein